MDINFAGRVARGLMKRHSLTDWQFQFNNDCHAFGLCRYNIKTIYLSRRFVRVNTWRQVKETILHEIAHALCPERGHGEQWQAKCREIGSVGGQFWNSTERTENIGRVIEAYAGTVVCSTCHRTIKKCYRKPTLYLQSRRCRTCHNLDNNSGVLVYKKFEGVGVQYVNQ